MKSAYIIPPAMTTSSELTEPGPGKRTSSLLKKESNVTSRCRRYNDQAYTANKSSDNADPFAGGTAESTPET